MGVIKRGILGGFSGRVANVVGSSWKGIAYMKSLPLSVANPQTAGQTAQRTRFTEAVRAATSVLAEFVKPLWDRFAQKMSGFNDIVSKNILAFDVNGNLIPASYKASIGTLTGFEAMSALADASGSSIECGFTDNSGEGNALSTDLIYLMYMNITQNYWGGGICDQTRVDASADFTDELIAIGDSLATYWSFRRADGTLVSNSEYKAVVVVA